MMIQEFNNNHAPDEQRPISTVRAAKIQVAKKPVKNPTDKIILLIAKVHKSINYFEIEWKNGSSLKLYFNGRYEKYKRNGKLASAGGVGSRKHTGIYENGHIFLFINGNIITFERLVAICTDFNHNCVAADYNGLLANMKDGSGSKDTADELGIPMNFHPDNIEWTTSQENGSHGYLIRELYKITGHEGMIFLIFICTCKEPYCCFRKGQQEVFAEKIYNYTEKGEVVSCLFIRTRNGVHTLFPVIQVRTGKRPNEASRQRKPLWNGRRSLYSATAATRV